MDRTEFARSVHAWIAAARPADRTIAGEITAAIVADADQYAAHLIERYAHPDYPAPLAAVLRAAPGKQAAPCEPLAVVAELPGGER